MQEMGAGMIAHGGVARRRVHPGDDLVAFLHRSNYLDLENALAWRGGVRGFDYGHGFAGGLRNQDSRVAHLAARFRIKGRAVERDFTVEDGRYRRLGLERFAADKLGPGEGLIDGVDLGLIRALPTCACARALLL